MKGTPGSSPTLDDLLDHDAFTRRHIGPDAAAVDHMLAVIGAETLDDLVDATVPASIRDRSRMAFISAMRESAAARTV